MQTSAQISPCLPVNITLLSQDKNWLLWLHTFSFLSTTMILNLPLILFQAREFEMAILFEVPSWNTLQICAQLTATICSCYCYLSCFRHNYMFSCPPTPQQGDTISVYRLTQSPTDTYSMPFISIVGVCNWLFTIDTHDSWNVIRPLPISIFLSPLDTVCCHLFSVQASSNYPLCCAKVLPLLKMFTLFCFAFSHFIFRGIRKHWSCFCLVHWHCPFWELLHVMLLI